MPEIGSTLREARMRARIDISEIEAETKIRAKYLRALENEEWDLLPGSTFVKSFLRTYAEALGLDAKLLLEEYKLRHERPTEQDLQPIMPRTTPGRRRPAPRGIPRMYLVAGVVAVLLAVLALLGSSGGGDDPEPRQANTVATAPETGTAAPTTVPRETAERSDRETARARRERQRRAAAARLVRLQIVPTAPVYVCLEAAGNRRLLNGVTLQPGSVARPFRSSRFEVTLGNGSATLRLDGKSRDVPDTGSGIGYVITKRNGRIQRSVLPEGRRPDCQG